MYLSFRFSFMVGGEGAAILWRDGSEAVAAGATVDGLIVEENRNADCAEGASEGGLGAKENPKDPEPKGAEAEAVEDERALATEKPNDDDDDDGGTGPLAVGTTLKGPAEAGRVGAAADARPRLGNAAGAEAIEAPLLGGAAANEPAQRLFFCLWHHMVLKEETYVLATCSTEMSPNRLKPFMISCHIFN